MNPKIYLAPMSGATDLAFRLISRKLGASHCFFEMLDAKSIVYNHPKNNRLIKTLEKDSPLAAQLLGADPSVMLDAAEKLFASRGYSGTTLRDVASAVGLRTPGPRRRPIASTPDCRRRESTFVCASGLTAATTGSCGPPWA